MDKEQANCYMLDWHHQCQLNGHYLIILLRLGGNACLLLFMRSCDPEIKLPTVRLRMDWGVPVSDADHVHLKWRTWSLKQLKWRWAVPNAQRQRDDTEAHLAGINMQKVVPGKAECLEEQDARRANQEGKHHVRTRVCPAYRTWFFRTKGPNRRSTELVRPPHCVSRPLHDHICFALCLEIWPA